MSAIDRGRVLRLRFLLRLFVLAVGINFVWEMAQMPLYRNMPFDDLQSWWLCFRASLGDGVIVLSIWAIGAFLFRRHGWFYPVRPLNAVVLLLSGAVIAIGIEIHALNTGRWAYSELMPLLPVIGVGASPIVQLLLLPWLSMRLAVKWRITTTKRASVQGPTGENNI